MNYFKGKQSNSDSIHVVQLMNIIFSLELFTCLNLAFLN